MRLSPLGRKDPTACADLGSSALLQSGAAGQAPGCWGPQRHSCCETGRPGCWWAAPRHSPQSRRPLCRPSPLGACDTRGPPTYLSWSLFFTQASELGHSLNESVLKPAQEKVTRRLPMPGPRLCVPRAQRGPVNPWHGGGPHRAEAPRGRAACPWEGVVGATRGGRTVRPERGSVAGPTPSGGGVTVGLQSPLTQLRQWARCFRPP